MSLFRSTSVLLIVLAGPVILGAQSDPALSRFVHPSAKALISIDWKHVRQSNVGATIREQLLNAGSNASFAIPGAEFLNDVDRFLISSSGRKSSDETSQDTPLLIVAEGHFDLAKLRTVLTKLGAKVQMFHSTQVYRPQGESGKDMAFVLLDSQTVLIGDAPSVFASLERSSFPAAAVDPNSVIARAAKMGVNYDAWVIVADPEELAGNHMDIFNEGQLGAGALGVEAGVALRSGLTADISVQFENELAAKNLVTGMSGFLKFAAMGKSNDTSLMELSKKLKFGSEGTVAKISLRLTPQELEKNAQTFASLPKRYPASTGALAGAVAIAQPPVQPATPPMPPEKMVVRIDGLEDGPREIPYKRQ
jgi:hypothetical protein